MLAARKAPLPQPTPTPTQPWTIEAVDGAILEIQQERARLLAALASLPAREAQLLDADAEDDAFVRLDIERKRADRGLGQLERREAELATTAERLQDDTKQRDFKAIRDRYIQASRALSDAAAVVALRIADVDAISLQADRAGFSRPMLPILPPVGYSSVGAYTVFGGHLAQLREQAAIAERTPAAIPGIPPQRPTQAVRLLRWSAVGTTAYQSGQIASFPAKICQQLIDAGAAERMARGMPYDPVAAAWGRGPVEGKDK